LASARDRPPLNPIEQRAILDDRLVSVRVVQLAEVDLAQYIRERSIQDTPESARSIPFSASHAWISTSGAPRSRRLNALTTTFAASGSTVSTPFSPRAYPTGTFGCG
jgi:hypothetical protein